jgi:hypothetical protein
MALTHLQLGELYVNKGGVLERRFLGAILALSLHIRMGWHADPTAQQIAWANHAFGCTLAEKERLARQSMEWGFINNGDLQQQGDAMIDGGISFVVAEHAKTWAGV